MEKYSELANIRTPHTAETMKLLGDYMSYVFRRIEFLRESCIRVLCDFIEEAMPTLPGNSWNLCQQGRAVERVTQKENGDFSNCLSATPGNIKYS